MLRKLPRSSLRAWTMGHLKSKQGGNCAVCGLPISLQVMGNKSDYVVDHCHESGEIRGVLHRSCNAALGKIDNAAGRWGAKSMKYKDIVPYLRRVVAYYDSLEANPTGLMYPDHKTPEEEAAASRLKRNKANAAKRARERARERAVLRKDNVK